VTLSVAPKDDSYVEKNPQSFTSRSERFFFPPLDPPPLRAIVLYFTTLPATVFSSGLDASSPTMVPGFYLPLMLMTLGERHMISTTSQSYPALHDTLPVVAPGGIPPLAPSLRTMVYLAPYSRVLLPRIQTASEFLFSGPFLHPLLSFTLDPLAVCPVHLATAVGRRGSRPLSQVNGVSMLIRPWQSRYVLHGRRLLSLRTCVRFRCLSNLIMILAGPDRLNFSPFPSFLFFLES